MTRPGRAFDFVLVSLALGCGADRTLTSSTQRLVATVSSQGLRIDSTASAPDQGTVRLRVIGLGRGERPKAVSAGRVHTEARADAVEVRRPELVEQYSSSGDGIRQDFLIASRPQGTGALRLALAVSGARVTQAGAGVRLALEASGRTLAYDRLYVSDALDRHIAARLVARVGGIDVEVEDHEAIYPLRIDPTLGDAQWHSFGGPPGVFGSVEAILAVPGPSDTLYVGGYLTAAENLPVKHIIKWDGSAWSTLGTGTNGRVYALARSSGGTIYAGGEFTQAGGLTANYVAKWDGASWSALGTGLNGWVYALAIDGSGNLYAGGSFTTAGGLAANRIARWDGASWSAVGAGTNGVVNALAFDGAGNLYVGGSFTTAGGSAANNVAKWDGATWSALGVGANNTVFALAVDGANNVFVGGNFTTAGGAAANHIAKWDGAAWSTCGVGISGTVGSIVLDGLGGLYAAGLFDYVGGQLAYNIARWDGTSWYKLGYGLSSGVGDLALGSSGALYVGGGFNTAYNTTGGVGAAGIVKWDGAAWSSFPGTGPNNFVYAWASAPSGMVYAAGTFTSVGALYASRVASWNGTSWSALAEGLTANVSATTWALVTDSLGNLYAGGEFDSAGAAGASRVARWNGTGWTPLWTGVNGTVRAVAADSANNLFAGGDFSTAGSSPAVRVAKWDGAAWSALGAGVNNTVYALTTDTSGSVYAGGSFTTAGAGSASYIAKWNGSYWSEVGNGMSGMVNALTTDAAGSLYAGGGFLTAGGTTVNYVAKWDGTSWSALGLGVANTVKALAVDAGGHLFAAGFFTAAGGSPASHIAMWDGTAWQTLGSGTDYALDALTVDAANNLYASGSYLIVAGNKISARAAWFDLPPSVKLSSTAANPTATVPIVVTATFNEPVTGLAATDFVVTNGTAGNLVQLIPNRVWTVDVTPLVEALVSVSLPADSVQAVSDSNGNFVSNLLTRVYTTDVTPPTVVSLVRVGPTPTNADSLAFTVTFSESVTAVGNGDFVLAATGNVAGNILVVAGGGATYTITVNNVTGDGTLRLDVSAGATISDLVNNPFAGPYTAGEVYAIDNTPPPAPAVVAVQNDAGTAGDFITNDTTLVISGSAEALANVQVFRAGTISLGTATADVSGAWSLDCTAVPFAAGAHSLTAKATDQAGNTGVTSAPAALTIDTTAPLVSSINRAAASPTRATSVTYTLTLSETVAGVDTADFVLTATGTASGTIASVAGGANTYTVTVNTVSGDGTLRLDLEASPTVSDVAGNLLAGPYTTGQTYAIDNTPPPAPVIAAVQNDSGAAGDQITNDTTLIVTGTAEANATVEVFRAGTISLGTASADGGGAFSLDCTATPFASSTHVLTAVATDAVGNASVVSSNFNLTVDTTPPAVLAVTRALLSPTNASSVIFSLTLSEAVTGVDTADLALSVTGTAAGTIASVTGSGSAYTVSVDSVAGNGTLRLDVIGAPTIADIAANPLAGPYTSGESYVIDTAAPAVVSMARTTSSPTAAVSLAFAVTLGEAVTGLDVTDFVLTTAGTAGASIASLSGSGSTYTVTVDSVTGDGTLRLDLAGSALAVDAAGNVIARPYTTGEAYLLDHTPPSVPSGLYVFDDTDVLGDGLTTDNTLQICGSTEADALVTVFVDGTSVGTVSADASGNFCYDHTAQVLSDGVHGFSALAADALGNLSNESAELLMTVSAQAPSVLSIARGGANPTNADTLDFIVTFSELVTGVDAADFKTTVTGTTAGTVAVVAGSSASYTVTVSGVAGDGTLGLDLAVGASIADAFGTGLVAAYPPGALYTVDHTPPDAPVVTSAAGSTEDKRPTWTWIEGTNAGNGQYRYQLDVLDTASWVETADTSFAPAADLAASAHTLYVAERDAAGNWSAAGSFTVTVTMATARVNAVGRGCACTTTGAGNSSTGLWLLAVGVVMVWSRRRRRYEARSLYVP